MWVGFWPTRQNIPTTLLTINNGVCSKCSPPKQVTKRWLLVSPCRCSPRDVAGVPRAARWNASDSTHAGKGRTVGSPTPARSCRWRRLSPAAKHSTISGAPNWTEDPCDSGGKCNVCTRKIRLNFKIRRFQAKNGLKTEILKFFIEFFQNSLGFLNDLLFYSKSFIWKIVQFFTFFILKGDF